MQLRDGAPETKQPNQTDKMSINEISAICKSTYGHDILAVDPTAACWVAENIAEATGKNVYRRISNARHKMGKGTSFPVAGSYLWTLICK
jgi:hypothetical protein